MQKLLEYFRENLLFILGIFFIAFIPLFPKRPLLDIVGTWVDIRLEDFFVAFSYVVLGFVLLRQKRRFSAPLTIPIILYWIIGLVSLINSLLFIGPYLPGFFPQVAILFYLRGIEYMGLFFVAFWSFRHSDKQLKWVIGVLAITVFAVFVYGVGQKYYGWPAFSTMNEEFAKGIPLRLPPTARVMSTFAGHYDLGAYLVLVIPILGSVIFSVKQKVFTLLLFIVTSCAFILLLFTASRISFGVYLVTISLMLWWQKKRLFIIPVVIASIIAVNFASGASERFLKTLRFDNVIVDLSTGKPIGTLEKLDGATATLEPIASPDQENLPKGSEYISVPVDVSIREPVDVSIRESVDATPPAIIQTVEFVKKANLATGSGEVATVSGSFLVQKAFVLDISITTRLQGQWPKAIDAFKRNILLGSGFSSLSLAADGNYHRLLGETGLLGTITYLGIFIYCFYWFFKVKERMQGLEKGFVIGVFAGISGLLLNAVLIDVFHASKVAFTLWLLLGFAMAMLSRHPLEYSYFEVLKKFFINTKAYAVYLLIAVFLIYGASISHYFIGDDFTWLRWAAESNIKDIPEFFTSASGFFYRPIPKLWYFGLFSVFWLLPQAYHIASLLLFGVSALFLAILLSHFHVKKVLITLLICFYLVMSVHHESVFWISNHSHLLGYTALLGSLLSFIFYWSTTNKGIRWYIIGVFLLFCSMFSYDIMIVAPVILLLFGGVLYGKWRGSAMLLGMIPLYLFMRSFSDAVSLSGDYGYNLAKFIPNSIANLFSYTLSMIWGPKALETMTLARIQLKSNVHLATLFGGVILFGFLGILVFFRERLKKEKVLFVLCSSYVLSLSMYLGLGGVTERYALYASGFFILFSGVLLQRIWDGSFGMLGKSIISIALVVVSAWNYRELMRFSEEWKFSSRVTEQTLQTMKQNFFPLTEHKTFIYINTPTRYGRAWIFPTGLEDALWHMYRESPFEIVQVASVQEAFDYPHKPGSAKVIFEFDKNFTLQQVVKEEVQ